MKPIRAFRCRHCRKLKREQVCGQNYCGDPTCQRQRKKSWRRDKYHSDPDYRLNQKASTQAWLESVGGAAEYYRQYRAKRASKRKSQEDLVPVSLSEGSKQATSPAKIDASPVDANRDVDSVKSSINSGRYVILPIGGANRDAILAMIEVISIGSVDLQISTYSSLEKESGKVPL